MSSLILSKVTDEIKKNFSLAWLKFMVQEILASKVVTQIIKIVSQTFYFYKKNKKKYVFVALKV